MRLTDEYLDAWSRWLWADDNDGASGPDFAVLTWETLAADLYADGMADGLAEAWQRFEGLLDWIQGRYTYSESDASGFVGLGMPINPSVGPVLAKYRISDSPVTVEATATRAAYCRWPRRPTVADHLLSIAQLWEELRPDPEPADYPPNPITPLIRAWQRGQLMAAPNQRDGRILPAGLGMAGRGDPRTRRFFMPASRQGQDAGGQLWLPGFERPRTGPAFPLALYGLGRGADARRQGHGAPLALRLFVEAVLLAPQLERGGPGGVDMRVSLREIRRRLYPASYKTISTRRIARDVEAAAEALDSMDARFPVDEGRGRVMWRVVNVLGIPHDLDADLTISVRLPPGASNAGPIIPDSLQQWGAKSAPAYNALIGLAYDWYNPGQTSFPVKRGRVWLRNPDPTRYRVYDPDALADLFYPLSGDTTRAHARERAPGHLEALAAAGDVVVAHTPDGDRILPPGLD